MPRFCGMPGDRVNVAAIDDEVVRDGAQRGLCLPVAERDDVSRPTDVGRKFDEHDSPMMDAGAVRSAAAPLGDRSLASDAEWAGEDAGDLAERVRGPRHERDKGGAGLVRYSSK